MLVFFTFGNYETLKIVHGERYNGGKYNASVW